MVSLTNVVFAIALAALGFAAALLGCKILNAIPAAWLCDYDEEPTEELKSGKRFFIKKHGIIMGVSLFAAICPTVITNGISPQLFVIVIAYYVLLLIASADAKYTIIPDQFTAAVAVIAVIFAVIDLLTTKTILSKWYEPLLGAAAGGGILIILDLFSMFVLKKDGFGFGDVKLMAALGVMLGWKYIIVVLMAASMIAAIHFLILIFTGHNIGEEGKYLPMGPYLCIGFAVAIIAQPWFESIFSMYRTVLEMETLP